MQAFLIAIIGFIALGDASAHQFNAPVPDRCTRFEGRYAPENKAFCDRWQIAHYVGPKR